jgi:hypothetical protein
VNLGVASSVIMKAPTQWTCGEGRCSVAWRTETASEVFRGSRDGMLRKINSPVLETRCSGVRGTTTTAYKGDRNRSRLHWESEGFKVPFEGTGQHNPARGKGPCFVRATKEWRMRGLQQCQQPR